MYALWGWGSPSDEPDHDQLVAAAPGISAVLGFPVQSPERPAAALATPLTTPRVAAPSALAALAGDEPLDRARHGLGRSYRDMIRGLRGRVDHTPDLVLRPRTEADVVATLDWCTTSRIAVVPFGGGTSVVGGVEPDVGDEFAGVVSLDLGALGQVVEVDPVSRAARVEAGALGPAIAAQLEGSGLTLRFYPQSYERSTLGGWIATRAAGHYATRLTHIDDVVASVRAVTPVGIWESRRLPASGAGPSPDRLLLGSEGTLGVVTSAWVRLQARPAYRAGATAAFATFDAGVQALRGVVQAGLAPAGLRLVDADEARLTGTLTDGRAVLVVNVESAHAPVDAELASVLEICADAGGELLAGSSAGGQWRQTFVGAPYLREQMMLLGVIAETFETAFTWDALDTGVAAIRAAATAAVTEVCGTGHVTCRVTHAYPDGAAPYFTVLAPARRGDELAQWAAVKSAASDAIAAAGGTITHHHAVGRDHRPWYDRQRPEPYAVALRAAKAAIDSAGVLNPGLLVG